MREPSIDSSVQVLSIVAPAMYADHHVLEVRRILLGLPGVEEVYASSCFRTVEVSYDSVKIDEAALRNVLSEAGYLDELQVPVESGSVADREKGEKPFFRHAAVNEHGRQAVSFGQVVITSSRSLWPCPGMGVIKKMEE